MNRRLNKQWTALPKGVYAARLIRVISLGTHFNPYDKSYALKLALVFELPGKVNELLNEDGEVITTAPSLVYKELSLKPNVRGGPFLEACKAFDSELQQTPDTHYWFKPLLGKAVTISLKVVESPTGLRNRAGFIYPLPKDLDDYVGETVNDYVWFDCYDYSSEMLDVYETSLTPVYRSLLLNAEDVASENYPQC